MTSQRICTSSSLPRFLRKHTQYRSRRCHAFFAVACAVGLGFVPEVVRAQASRCTYTPNVAIQFGQSAEISTTKVEYRPSGSTERTTFNKTTANQVLKGERTDEYAGETTAVDFYSNSSENPLGNTTRGAPLRHENKSYPKSGERDFQRHSGSGSVEASIQNSDLQRALVSIDNARAKCP